MQLTYRGVNYETNSATVPTPVPATDLKYRGASYRLHQAARTEALEAILKYRGAIYGGKKAQRAAIVAPASQASSVQEQARLLTMNHHRLIKNREQSMLRRAAAQVGVNTTNYWNHIQGKVHPTFRATYDRSAATMS
jgi:hypothetical protein